MGRGILHAAQLELPACLNHGPGLRGVSFPGQLDQNLVLAAADDLNRRLGQSKSIDAALDRVERLLHGLLLDGGNRGRPHGQQVAGSFPGSGAGIPLRPKNVVEQIAELRELVRGDVAYEDVRVIHAANFVVADILVPELAGQPVHRLVRFLADGFLHLHLQDQVRPALQVQSELNLLRKISLDDCQGLREVGQSEKPVQTNQDDAYNEDYLPPRSRIQLSSSLLSGLSPPPAPWTACVMRNSSRFPPMRWPRVRP